MDITVEQVVEALLFASESPMKLKYLAEIFEEEEFEPFAMNEEMLEKVLAGLKEKYESPSYIFELKEVAGGYQFFTKKEFYPFARVAALSKSKKKLSRSSMETLSIIAYRQPITKTELEFIRGVGCDYALHKLLDKKLIEIQGRSDAPGRPLLYGTSVYFMEYFGINDLKDLPKLEEISLDEEEFQAQFKVYLEDQDGDDETADKNEEDQQNEGEETDND